MDQHQLLPEKHMRELISHVYRGAGEFHRMWNCALSAHTLDYLKDRLLVHITEIVSYACLTLKWIEPNELSRLFVLEKIFDSTRTNLEGA